MARSMYSTLTPNAVYQGSHGQIYHTDNYGRVIDFDGYTSLERVPRDDPVSKAAQRDLPGKCPDVSTAGHVFAASQGGDTRKYNMVPQEYHLNTRDYKAFEQENYQYMQQGYNVHLNGNITYLMTDPETRELSTTNVPDSIMLERTVTDASGQVVDHDYLSWTNVDAQEFHSETLSTESVELMNEFPNPGAVTEETTPTEQEIVGTTESISSPGQQNEATVTEEESNVSVEQEAESEIETETEILMP